MSTSAGPTPGTRSGQTYGEGHQYSGGAVGMLIFAGTMMVLAGVFEAFQGLVAILDDSFYVVGEEYVLQLDVTTWGWIHLILGIVVALAGVGLFQGATWSRAVAVVMASLAIVANFFWMPYYPLWSLTIITLSVLVIWAAAAHGRDIRDTD
jgi:hypothetical protein